MSKPLGELLVLLALFSPGLFFFCLFLSSLPDPGGFYLPKLGPNPLNPTILSPISALAGSKVSQEDRLQSAHSLPVSFGSMLIVLR
jgi:hypothetical protein